ncbi:MAG: hypothetical protein SGBAC_005192 [Bacillariaceae sp.]
MQIQRRQRRLGEEKDSSSSKKSKEKEETSSTEEGEATSQSSFNPTNKEATDSTPVLIGTVGATKPSMVVDTTTLDTTSSSSASSNLVNNSNNNNNNSNNNNSSSKSLNVTAISMTTCVKIEYAVSYLTSLDWKDIDVVATGTDNSSGPSRHDENKIWMDVYLLQLVLLPASLSMVLFGSQLLLPVCTMTAAGLGVFCIFHFVNSYFKGGLDCPMKLALSGVSATLAAMGAAAFVRFGLFTLGTVSAGGLSYLFFDAFPELDPAGNFTAAVNAASATGAEAALASDISPHAWVITIVVALAGGLFLRLYEQASLEVLTAILGGVGVSYSVHAIFLSRHVDLDRSVVFLTASTVGLIGWRFQRRRRLRLMELQANPYHDYAKIPVHHHHHAPPPPPPPATAAAAAAAAEMMPPTSAASANNPNLSLNNWNQLQYSLYSTNHLLQQQRQGDDTNSANEMEAMAEELTNLLNSFQERIQERDRSKKQ